MGIFLPGKQRRPRQFSYEPRFYNPEKDENIKRRMRIQSHARRRRNPMSIMYFIIVLGIILYLFRMLA